MVVKDARYPVIGHFKRQAHTIRRPDGMRHTTRNSDMYECDFMRHSGIDVETGLARTGWIGDEG